MRRFLIGALLAGGLLSSCASGTGANPARAATPSPPPFSPTPLASATVVPGIVILSSGGVSTSGVELAQQAIQVLAASRGWRLRPVSAAAETLRAAIEQKPVLIVSLASGLGELLAQSAQANPSLRFVAVEEPQARPEKNLLVIGATAREDEEAFLAGALAGIDNSNRRVGWIGELESQRGKIYGNGFLHGVRYTCPRCWVYPYELPSGSSAEAGLAASDSLRADYVDTASAIPGPAGDRALLELSSGLVRVSSPDPGLWARVFGQGQGQGASNVLGWARTRPDLLLAKALPDFLEGTLEGTALPYSLEDGGLDLAASPNPWISPGLQANLAEMLARLRSGELDIGVNPETGDPE